MYLSGKASHFGYLSELKGGDCIGSIALVCILFDHESFVHLGLMTFLMLVLYYRIFIKYATSEGNLKY